MLLNYETEKDVNLYLDQNHALTIAKAESLTKHQGLFRWPTEEIGFWLS